MTVKEFDVLWANDFWSSHDELRVTIADRERILAALGGVNPEAVPELVEAAEKVVNECSSRTDLGRIASWGPVLSLSKALARAKEKP